MHTVGQIPVGTTRKDGHKPDGTGCTPRNAQDGKDYGSKRGRNPFLTTSFHSIAPTCIIGEGYDTEEYNVITRENYEFLRDSYFRYAELMGASAPHNPGKSIGEGISNLFHEMAALLGDTMGVNYEEDCGRLYFNLWQPHTWGEYTLYYFPIRFVESLNPRLRRIALSFLHHLMRGNGFTTINDEDDMDWVFNMLSHDGDDGDEKEYAGQDRLVQSYKDGRIYRLLDRVSRKPYYKNLHKAIDRYECQNDMERELVGLMREGLEFTAPAKPIMHYAYDPWYDDEPEYYPMELGRQIRVVYDCGDIITDYLEDYYNSSRQETYDITPVTTFALSPKTDRLFTLEDTYPERFFKWADKFINYIIH